MALQQNDPRPDADSALADRQASLARYADISSISALEAFRARLDAGTERDDLDSLILVRRRATKASLEDLTATADMFDKAALPAAAALPVFLTFLASEKLLVEPWRTKVLIGAYLLGGAVWLFCRWKSYQSTRLARIGAAELGKVD